MNEYDSINSARQLSKYDRIQMGKKFEQEQKEAERTANLNKNFQSIVAEMQTQNKILAQQVEDAKRESEEAKKDARNAKVFSWITFAVSTLIAVASLVVAIVK